MKIAIYQPRCSYYVGGGEVVPLEHAKFFTKLGHEVTLITTDTNQFGIHHSDYFTNFLLHNPKVSIEYIKPYLKLDFIYQMQPGVNWERWDMESLFLSQLGVEYFSCHNFDIIAFHNVIDYLAAPISAKSVLHLHGFPKTINYINYLIFKIRPNLISVSSLVTEKWANLINDNSLKITTYTNGIDCDKFQPIPNFTKIYDIVYIGRLIEIKGIKYILEAVNQIVNIRKTFPQIKFAIAGHGEMEEYIESFIHYHNLANNIKVLGYVKEEDKVALYNSSKIGIFPSYDKEGILTTMLEAASCGVPIITTQNSSMTEFAKHMSNSLLVKPQDSNDLATAIEKLLEDEALTILLGNNCRKDITSKWSWKVKSQAIIDHYEHFINS